MIKVQEHRKSLKVLSIIFVIYSCFLCIPKTPVFLSQFDLSPPDFLSFRTTESQDSYTGMEEISSQDILKLMDNYSTERGTLNSDGDGLLDDIRSEHDYIEIVPVENGMYTVQKGDTIYKISKIVGNSVEELLKNNNALKNDKELILSAGDKIKVMVKNVRTKNYHLNISKDIAKLGFILPIKYRGITSEYGKRFHPILKRNIFHKGIDLKAKVGTTLMAPANGRVIFAGNKGNYGKIIIIQHNLGYITKLAHLSRITVSVGAEVTKGEVIGYTGNTGRSTGPHLHYEVIKDGETINPCNLM